MAPKMAVDLCEDPSSVDELVRDIEDSGYPVDFSREQVICQPERLSAVPDTLLTVPRRLGSAHTKCTTARDRTSSPQPVRQNPDPLSLTELTEESIRRRAYQFYVERGRKNGHDFDDWLRAEEQVLGKGLAIQRAHEVGMPL
jgi:Protein of unknown function (DUF2934)